MFEMCPGDVNKQTNFLCLAAETFLLEIESTPDEAKQI